MHILIKRFVWSLLLLSGLFITGCPEKTSIATIEANPSRFENKEVAVAGVVKDSYGLNIPGTRIAGGAYKLDDGTGSIWIMTDGSVPAKGSRIGVKGKVGTGVNWKGKTYGLGMFEIDRRLRKR